mgnify:CR=1 FL=1
MEVAETGGAAAGAGASGGLPAAGPIPGIVWVPAAIFLVVAAAVLLPTFLLLDENWSCNVEDAKRYYIKLVDEPRASKIEAPMICPYYRNISIFLSGSGYLRWNDVDPDFELDNETLTLDSISGCSEFEVRGQTAEICDRLNLTVPQLNYSTAHFGYMYTALPLHTQETHALNKVPDDPRCDEVNLEVVAIVPPPDILDIFPPAFCKDTVHVLDFTVVDVLPITREGVQTRPDIIINGQTISQELSEMLDCTNFTALSGEDRLPVPWDNLVEICSLMSVTLDV